MHGGMPAIALTAFLLAIIPRPALAQAAAPVLPVSLVAAPLIRQATSYSCGAAALLSSLRYWQAYGGSEAGLYPLLETTPKDGTEPPKIAEGARRLGLRVRMRKNATLRDLRSGLHRGETVILDIQAWADASEARLSWKDRWEDGHYVVLVGMDDRFAYVMDPSIDGRYGYLPLDELSDRWHDYEDRHGPRQVYNHLAIFVKGKTPLHWSPPDELTRVQ
jgi:uncharacterized protein